VALEVIRRVTEDGAYSNLALFAALDRSRLTGRDRDLTADLAYGTIRRLLSLDWALSAFTDRPLHRAPPQALALLRLGAYQLLFSRVPPHAAVSETVGLARRPDRGFVNAVLRKLAATPPTWPAGPADEEVSVRTGLVPWAFEELRRLLGEEAEEAAGALATRSSLGLRANTCRITTDVLLGAIESAGHRPRRGAIHPDTVVVDGGDPRSLPGYREGWFAVQDEASAFVVSALGPRPGERMLDVCAGPGGKAGHAGCEVAPDGLLVAADAAVARARLTAEAARRLGIRIHVLAQDARHPALRGTFDRVLVDAPCSGLGSARRRPELLWRPRREQLSALARLQVAIASSAANLLRPGGRLVYSVCTYPRAETDAACDALFRFRPDLVPDPISGPDGSGTRVRLWPHRHGTDAMFVAAFRRSA
jgi:16S rRNA (cytosine967-C5)-methyltransferase